MPSVSFKFIQTYLVSVTNPATQQRCICDALRDLVPFVQFQKHEKHPWGSVNFIKVAGQSLETLLHGCFSRFSNWANVTKSRNASHLGRCQKSMVEHFCENKYWLLIVNYFCKNGP